MCRRIRDPGGELLVGAGNGLPKVKARNVPAPAKDIALLRREDPEGVRHFLAAFGGMGSLNDVTLSRPDDGPVRRWYRGRFDSTRPYAQMACASRLRARSTRLDVVADELHRRAVDAAAVLLDLVVADRRHVDAALLELLGRARIALAHEHAPRLEDERVDRPELVGIAPNRLDAELGEAIEERVRKPGRVDESLVDVDHREVAVEVDRKSAHRHDQQFDSKRSERICELPGALVVAADRRAERGHSRR